MNILFLTMNIFTDIEMHNIYSDLMKVFISNGHRPFIVTPREQKSGEKTELLTFNDYSILKVQIGNTSGVSLIEKGLTTVTLSRKYYQAVSKNLGAVKFDLILYSTPPITLMKPIRKLKKKYRCNTYLMLKDIFPQNAVDLGMFSERGIIHRFFRKQEKALYRLSDRIGCMSPANVAYVLKHNPEIDRKTVELCPNGIIAKPKEDRSLYKKKVRDRFSIPNSAVIYLYGGNLGRPQGIPHMIRCLEQNVGKSDRFFLVCGSGTEYHQLEEFFKGQKPNNARLMHYLPKTEYDELAAGCDVGLIFLDNRFTIPNYPSRILSYMENEMPVVVCSDASTDVGAEAEKNGYGFFCTADNPSAFSACIDRMNAANREEMGKTARKYLEEHFTSQICYETVMKRRNQEGEAYE